MSFTIKDIEIKINTIFGYRNVFYGDSSTFYETDQFKNRKEHICYSFQVISINHMQILDLVKYFKELSMELTVTNIPFMRDDDTKLRIKVTFKDFNDVIKLYNISDLDNRENLK